MKLVINQGLDCDESEVIINCRYMDERLKRLAQYIEQFTFCLEGYRGDELLRVPIEKICYIESVEDGPFYIRKRRYPRAERASSHWKNSFPAHRLYASAKAVW